VWITRAGTEIVYGQNDTPDAEWSRTIAVDWNRERVEESLLGLGSHLKLQEEVHQGEFKVSYLLRQSEQRILSLVRQRLRQRQQAARPSLRCHWFLDVTPIRASRSEAIRYLSLRWGLPLDQILVVASEQGDGELVQGLPATVVLAEHDPSLDGFRHQQRVFFASRQSMSGVLEGIQHYRFQTRR
jgi:sucrose-phosphate synthase